MKIKSKLTYDLFKLFPKKFLKLFNRFYDHKLSCNLLFLLKKDLKVEVVYDIGAFRGEWSSYLNKTSLKNKQFILFEANKENEPYLKKEGFKYFIELLSNEEKDLKFYSQVSTGDSYFLEQTTFYKNNMDPQIIKATTLDNLVGKNNIPSPDFIKIDTQGSELDILKGAKKTISEFFTSSSLTSSLLILPAVPKKVTIVLSESGVMRIKQEPVGIGSSFFLYKYLTFSFFNPSSYF